MRGSLVLSVVPLLVSVPEIYALLGRFWCDVDSPVLAALLPDHTTFSFSFSVTFTPASSVQVNSNSPGPGTRIVKWM